MGPVDGTCSSGLALTSRLTGTVIVGVAAPGAEIVIVPVQLFGVNPVVLIWTLMAAGVALFCGDTTSQLFPHDPLVEALSEKLMVPPPVEVTLRVCAAGVLVPV